MILMSLYKEHLSDVLSTFWTVPSNTRPFGWPEPLIISILNHVLLLCKYTQGIISHDPSLPQIHRLDLPYALDLCKSEFVWASKRIVDMGFGEFGRSAKPDPSGRVRCIGAIKRDFHVCHYVEQTLVYLFGRTRLCNCLFPNHVSPCFETHHTVVHVEISIAGEIVLVGSNAVLVEDGADCLFVLECLYPSFQRHCAGV